MADKAERIRPVPDMEGLAIRMAGDRVLVHRPGGEGERKSRGGLVIPATAASASRRCIWAEVAAVGPNVRNIEPGDNVLIVPESGFEVEIRAEEYLLLRERDVHAIAGERVDAGTGLYL